MTPVRAVPQSTVRRAAAGGLRWSWRCAVRLRPDAPNYAMGLFGQHGVAVITRAPNGVMQYLR